VQRSSVHCALLFPFHGLTSHTGSADFPYTIRYSVDVPFATDEVLRRAVGRFSEIEGVTAATRVGDIKGTVISVFILFSLLSILFLTFFIVVFLAIIFYLEEFVPTE
jgi:hypothetical protein